MSDKEWAKERLDELLNHWQAEFDYLPVSKKSMVKAVAYAKEAINALEDQCELVVKINTHGNSLPVQHGEWIDLTTANDVEMHKGEYMVISLGVSMELPKGSWLCTGISSSSSRMRLYSSASLSLLSVKYREPEV